MIPEPEVHIGLAKTVQGFIMGVIAELAREKAANAVKGPINQALGEEDVSQEQLMKDIHAVSLQFLKWLGSQEAVQGDVFNFYTLYKAGQGPPLRLKHSSNRQYWKVQSGVAITVNVNETGLGNFNYNIPVGTWTAFDFPDGASLVLDASAPNNAQQIWVRETDQF